MCRDVAHTACRSVKYRLLPGDQATGRRRTGLRDACRFTWNALNEAREIQNPHACGRRIDTPTLFTPGMTFKALWDAEPWLHDHSCAVVRDTLKYRSDARKAFIAGQGGWPKWKNCCRTPLFTIPDDVRIRDGCQAVPSVGRLSLRRRGGNPYPDGKPVKAVVRREDKLWYATICYRVKEGHTVPNGHAIGVDRIVGQVAHSDGEIHRLQDLSRLGAKLRRHERALSRNRNGSKRCECACRKATPAARRMANARKEWQHRTSRNVADKAGTVVIEMLNTRGMTRSAKGTNEANGIDLRAKAGLNRAILNTGWAAMEEMLSCWALERVRVPAGNTSQACSACGVIDADLRCPQASFVCVACGQARNADRNAARNTLASATGASARRGAFVSVPPVTRETDTDDTPVQSSIEVPKKMTPTATERRLNRLPGRTARRCVFPGLDTFRFARNQRARSLRRCTTAVCARKSRQSIKSTYPLSKLRQRRLHPMCVSSSADCGSLRPFFFRPAPRHTAPAGSARTEVRLRTSDRSAAYCRPEPTACQRQSDSRGSEAPPF